MEDDITGDLEDEPDDISIHVPRVEDDLRQNGCCRYTIPFQSTSPVWRTTNGRAARAQRTDISIHVPRVEDDSCKSFA